MAQENRQSVVEDKYFEEEGSSLIRVESLPSPGENVDPVAAEKLTHNQNVNNVNPEQDGKNK